MADLPHLLISYCWPGEPSFPQLLFSMVPAVKTLPLWQLFLLSFTSLCQTDREVEPKGHSELRCSYVTLPLWVNCFTVNSEYSLGHFWNRKHGQWCCFTSLEFLNSGGFEWGRSRSATPAAECVTVSCLHLAPETDWEEGRFEKLHQSNVRDFAVCRPRIIERRGSSLQSESSVKNKTRSSFSVNKWFPQLQLEEGHDQPSDSQGSIFS